MEVEEFFERAGACFLFGVLVEPLEKDFDDIFDNIFKVFLFPPVLGLGSWQHNGGGFILNKLNFGLDGLFEIINLRVYFYSSVGIFEVELILNFNDLIFEVDKGGFGQFVVFIHPAELVDHVDPLGGAVLVIADLELVLVVDFVVVDEELLWLGFDVSILVLVPADDGDFILVHV